MLDSRVAPEIARAFALGDPEGFEGPVARGEQGQIWRLETTLGSWAVREPFQPQTEAEVREDADFQQAARRAGVPTPRSMRTTAGDVIAAVADTQVRVYEWVDLRDVDIGLDPAAVGRLLARLHAVPFEGSRPEDAWYTDPVGADRWDELTRELAANGAAFADALAAMRDELVALEAWIEPAVALRACHRDLWADNLRLTAAGGLCVIDWDNCGAADPSHELANALFEFASGDIGRARALERAYSDAGGSGRITGHGSFSMTIAQLGHILEISCADWLDPTLTAAEREHTAGRVAEFVERPLTRALIDTLIAAVA
jgi:Ser/Thr protein kinase RdoA (MazF antagonist)